MGLIMRLATKSFTGRNFQGQITLYYFCLFVSGFFLRHVESLDLGPDSNSQYCKIRDTGDTMSEDHKPKFIAFDLDYTLWPFWVDTHVDPPFNQKSDGKVYDSRGTRIKHFPEVPKVLKQLHGDGYKLGIASRTSAIEDGAELVKLFDWKKYFHFSEIYPGVKTTHFKRFHEDSKIPYEEMMFFDDEHRNIVDVGKLGVTCILVNDGVTHEVVQEGFKTFAKNRSKGKC